MSNHILRLSIVLNLEVAMKFFISDSNFLPILSESTKLLPKNGKLMAFVALFSVLLTSSVFLLFFYTLRSMLVDMFVTSQKSSVPGPNSFDGPDPSSLTTIPGFSPALIDGPQEDLAILLAVEIAFFLVFFVVSFFSTISTILLSAFSYKAKNLSLKELFSILFRTWTRPLITTFYISALGIGYFAVVFTLYAPLLVYRSKCALSVAILIGIIALVFYLYLSVIWALAVVVSVVEESCYGMEALGKASALVKGKKLQGFLLNVCFELLVWVIFRGYRMMIGDKGLVNYPIISGFFVVKFFVFVAYTVFYFQCKELHGEEVELHGNVDYTKLQNLELGSDMA